MIQPTDNFYCYSGSNTLNLCLQALPSSAPTLTSPADGALLSTQPTLTWNRIFSSRFGVPCNGASNSYFIEISSDNFASTVYTATVSSSTSSHAPLQTILQGTYKWRVSAQTDPSLRSASSVFTFTICLPVAPIPPTVFAPNGIGFIDSTSVLLAWNATSNWGSFCGGALNYKVYFGSSSFTSASVDSSTLQYQVSIPSNPGSVTYQWYVSAATPLFESFSAIASFTVCFSQAPSMPVLTRPLNGSAVDENSFATLTYEWSPSSGINCADLSVTPRYTVYQDTRSILTTLQALNSAAKIPTTPISPALSSLSFTPGAALLPGWYNWSVTADIGSASTSSAVFSFRICRPVAPSFVRTLSTPVLPTPYILNFTGAFNPGEDCVDRSIDQYLLYIGSSPSSLSLFDSSAQTILSLALTDGAYSYQIVANNGKLTGSSPVGSFVICTPSAPQTIAPIFPADQSTVTASSTITLSWEQTTKWGTTCGAPSVHSIELRYRAASTSLWTVVQFNTTIASFYAISASSGTYHWQVITSNGQASFTLNAVFTAAATCIDTPPAAFDIVATPAVIANYPLSLYWQTNSLGSMCTPISGGNSYTILLDSSNPPKTPFFFTRAMPHNIDNGLQVGVKYYWSVQAVGSSTVNALSVSSFQLCITRSPSATLLSPAINSRYVLPSSVLSWSYSAGLNCASNTTVRISVLLSALPIPNPTDVLASGYNIVNTTLRSGLSDMTYYWRVMVDNGHESVLSSIFNFTQCTARPPSEAYNLAPSSGIVDPNPLTFQWSAGAPGRACQLGKRAAAEYRVIYANSIDALTSSNASAQSSSAFLSALSWSPVSDSALVLADGTYFWRVESSLDTARGKLTSLSSISQFSVCMRRVPTAPLQIFPVDGDTLDLSLPLSLQFQLGDVGNGCSCSCTREAHVRLTLPNGTTITQTYSLIAGSFSFNLPSALQTSGTFSWSVVSIDTTNQFASPQWRFTLCLPTPPLPPLLDSPPNATSNVQSGDVLSWFAADFGTACGRSGTYELFFGKTPQPPFYTSIGSSLNVAVPPVRSGTYYWKIETTNGWRRSFNSSETRMISVCNSGTPPPTQLIAPTDGLVVYSSFAVLQFSLVPLGFICANRSIVAPTLALILNRVSSTTEAPTQLLSSVPYPANSTDSVFSLVARNLTLGLYAWQIQVTNAAGKQSLSLARYFSICLDLPPNANPTQLRAPSTQSELTFVTFSWNAVGDYGSVCNPLNVNRQITIVLSLAGSNTTDAIAFLPQYAVSYAYPNELAHGTSYTWKLQIDNGPFQVETQSLSFKTREFTCTNWPCNVQHSNCSDSATPPSCFCFNASDYQGQFCDVPVCPDSCVHGACVSGADGARSCQCYEGYSGTTCSVSATTQSSAVLLRYVLPVVLVLLLLIVLLIVLILRRRRREERLEKQLVEPNYAELAFLPVKVPVKAIAYDDENPAWDDFENTLLGYGDGQDEELVLARALYQTCMGNASESESFARALTYLFYARDKMHELIRVIAAAECQMQEVEVLFRGNTLFTKIMKSYTRILGLPFLFHALGPTMHLLLLQYKHRAQIEEETKKAKAKDVELGSEMFFSTTAEIDPVKLEEMGALLQVDTNMNAAAVRLSAQRIFSRLQQKASLFHPQLSDALRIINDTLQDIVPNEQRVVIVSSFVFLRYVNPAVIAPETHGLTQASTEEFLSNARTELLMIGKLLQNLSNRVKFGAKEAVMSKMNDFIDSNGSNLDSLLNRLLNVETTTANNVRIEIPQSVVEDSLRYLHSLTAKQIDRVNEILTEQQANNLRDMMLNLE
jgi:hypothetical protein